MFVVDITNCWWWNILAKLVLLRLPWNLLVFVLKYPSVMRHRSISEGVQRWRRFSRYTVCQPLVHFDGQDLTPMKKRVITGQPAYFSSTLLFNSRPWGTHSSLRVFTAYPELKLSHICLPGFQSFQSQGHKECSFNIAGSSPGFPNGRTSGTPSPCYPGDRPVG